MKFRKKIFIASVLVFTVLFNFAFINCSDSMHSESSQQLFLEEGDDRNFALLDGDMLIEDLQANDQTIANKAGRDLADINASYWKDGLIPLKFEVGFTESEKSLVRMACFTWSYQAKVSCVDYKSSVHGTNYLNVTKSGSGCYANFGKPNSGPAYLNLSTKEAVSYSLPQGTCMMLGIAMHEFGHVLGMAHEHSRPDRDTYIAVNTANLKSTCVESFKFKYLNTDLVRVGKIYDFKSIMHYAKYHCSANGKPTISPKEPWKSELAGYDLGDSVLENPKLSEEDANFARQVYGAWPYGVPF
jgi:hypothetical protein